jgi:hypothetical protein
MIEVRRMWEPHGPLRETSETRHMSSFFMNANGLYVGRYVCGLCDQPCSGVYYAPDDVKSRPSARSEWICGNCRTKIRPKQEQPASLRQARSKRA